MLALKAAHATFRRKIEEPLDVGLTPAYNLKAAYIASVPNATVLSHTTMLYLSNETTQSNITRIASPELFDAFTQQLHNTA
eukprot:3499774-Ditylum_brightwellii.AAC.1